MGERTGALKVVVLTVGHCLRAYMNSAIEPT